MSQLIASAPWATFVEETANGRSQHQFEVLRLLTAPDVADLAALFMGGAPAERKAALRILHELDMQEDPRLGNEIRARIAPGLRTIVDAEYPTGAPSRSAMFFWLRIDQDRAAEFLNAWCERHDLADADAASVTLHLSLGNATSLTRLRRLHEARPGMALAHNAVLVLERTAPNWKEKLAEYGRRWRRQRDCPGLLHLTNQLIDRRPREEAYLADIVAVLGPPDAESDGQLTYYAKDQERIVGYLYLDGDANGKVHGWKLDNC